MWSIRSFIGIRTKVLEQVLKRDELEAIAEVVKKHPQLIVISDEVGPLVSSPYMISAFFSLLSLTIYDCSQVYEFMTYDSVQHERIAKVPGMWERTVTIRYRLSIDVYIQTTESILIRFQSLSSAGKTFSSTGWKVGWCVGPENLISSISVVHSYIPFSISTPLQVYFRLMTNLASNISTLCFVQEAVAVGFEEAESRKYFAEFQANYLKRRDKVTCSPLFSSCCRY